MIFGILAAGAVSLGAATATAQNPVAYRIFDNSGHEVSFTEMIDSLSRAKTVFVGENHNCPVAHWMEFEIARALHGVHGDKLVIGEEMMEADNQLILAEYMNRKISYDRFEAEARLWPNYSTDYYPVIFYAKENNIPFVATNVPRRYANSVSNSGLECLADFSEEATRYMAPLPIEFNYDSDEAAGQFGAMQMLSRRSPEELKHLAAAQALKDATMAWFISSNLTDTNRFLHINGTMHSDGRGGIIPYLLSYRPGTSVATVTTVRIDDMNDTTTTLDPDYLGAADYYIAVPTDFPTSY